MNRLNAFRWFVFGFLTGIWAIWLCLVLIFQDDSSAQAKLNPLFWGCLTGQFIIIIPLSLLSSKARKYQQNQKEALEAASLVSSQSDVVPSGDFAKGNAMNTVPLSKRINAITAGSAALVLAAVSPTGCARAKPGLRKIDDTQTGALQDANNPAASKDSGIYSSQKVQEISTYLIKLSESGTGTTETRPNKIEYLPDISPTRFHVKNLSTQYDPVKTNLQISPAGTSELPGDIESLPRTRYSPDYKAYRTGCDTGCEKHKERPFASGTAIHQIDLKAEKSSECIAASKDDG